MENRVLTITVSVLLVGGIVGCVWIISSTELRNTETLFLSVVLAVLSMVASWICSRYYAEATFNRNLRFFALKAAEKVTNLSNEFDRLSAFLQLGSQSRDYDSPKEALQARDQRIEAAIKNKRGQAQKIKGKK